MPSGCDNQKMPLDIAEPWRAKLPQLGSITLHYHYYFNISFARVGSFACPNEPETCAPELSVEQVNTYFSNIKSTHRSYYYSHFRLMLHFHGVEIIHICS